ncbi:hypothetical protein [Streptosporangium sp. KLBMP 9127]|nr:hypothetical protein [Streptosporangium sp. KLBMP 9127]
MEIDRLVNCAGCVGVAGRLISVGLPLAGKRVTLRIDGKHQPTTIRQASTEGSQAALSTTGLTHG